MAWTTFRESISQDYDYVALSQYVDLMCFTQVSYETKSQALKVLHMTNLEERLNGLIELGLPSTKLVMDLYFLGYQFTAKDTFDYSSTLVYYEICNFVASEAVTKWERIYDKEAGLAYLNRKGKSDIDDITQIAYQSTRAVANRVRLAMKLNLAGVLALPMNVDDFHGKCGIDEDTFIDFGPIKVSADVLQKKCPVLRTINEAILLSVNKTDSIAAGSTGAVMCSIVGIYYIMFVLIELSLS